MKALFHHPTADWNGQARAFAAAAGGLSARGWDTLFACCPDTDAHRHAEANGLRVHALGRDEGFVAGSTSLARAVRAQAIEVVFVHGERAQLAAAGGAWRASRGLVVRRFGVGEEPALGRTARTVMRSTPTALLCTWPEQWATLPKELTVVTGEVGVPTPLDLPDADDRADAPGDGTLRRVVGICGRDGRSRTSTLLRAVSMLAPRHPELRVALVGPGSDDEELRIHAAALGVHRLVTHLGGRSEARDLLGGADLGWVLADGDDGAFGALDCMAAGVPALVERESHAARYAPDAIGAVHLEPGDVAGAAAVIARLLAHDAERMAMGAAGRARVARTFPESAMLDGFERAATGARGPGPPARR
jgi:glycosyltransferase involved in cell wall biosynthesis